MIGKRIGKPGELLSTELQAKADSHDSRKRTVLVTGGAGFIGANLTNRLALEGLRVIVYDNLSRDGVTNNLDWLVASHGNLIEVERADTRDLGSLRRVIDQVSQVFHLAAQVAVTTSLIDPIEDFEINARGTLNLLECIRSVSSPPSLIFTSTNKVYGGLEDLRFRRLGNRYVPEEENSPCGINEDRPLDFHSPYGCSKGAADQYVIDYARTYGLPASVFRMSCIYGPHQFGNEDQGWVAHFLIRAIEGFPITIYGNGLQVRDILFVDDLLDAMQLAQRNIQKLSGNAFNIGGGADNTISLLELLDLISDLQTKEFAVEFERWRPADQRFYVSDTSRFRSATGWAPKVTVRDGIGRLYQWLKEKQSKNDLSATNSNLKTDNEASRSPQLVPVNS